MTDIPPEDELPPPLERPALDDTPIEEEPADDGLPPALERPALDAKPRESLLVRLTREQAPNPYAIPTTTLRRRSRRDFLLFGAGIAATAFGARWLLGSRSEWHERTLDRALAFDDDVAAALYSPTRSVPTYSRRDVTPLRNNYHSPTPNPSYLASWSLTLSGLASGTSAVLRADDLRRFAHHEQVTRLVCVEGWSAIAWWGGIRFRDLLAAHAPHPRAKWAAMIADNDHYYVSIDLDTARHPQTLLATHHDGAPLTIAHGAPLRLVVPMKLGLKNIKAVTRIEYSEHEPPDFWGERGYSRYDGI